MRRKMVWIEAELKANHGEFSFETGMSGRRGANENLLVIEADTGAFRTFAAGAEPGI